MSLDKARAQLSAHFLIQSSTMLPKFYTSAPAGHTLCASRLETARYRCSLAPRLPTLRDRLMGRSASSLMQAVFVVPDEAARASSAALQGTKHAQAPGTLWPLPQPFHPTPECRSQSETEKIFAVGACSVVPWTVGTKA
jgi:hypothetical protein